MAQTPSHTLPAGLGPKTTTWLHSRSNETLVRLASRRLDGVTPTPGVISTAQVLRGVIDAYGTAEENFFRAGKVLPVDTLHLAASTHRHADALLAQHSNLHAAWERRLQVGDMLSECGVDPAAIMTRIPQYPFRILALTAPLHSIPSHDVARWLITIESVWQKAQDPWCQGGLDLFISANAPETLRTQSTLTLDDVIRVGIEGDATAWRGACSEYARKAALLATAVTAASRMTASATWIVIQKMNEYDAVGSESESLRVQVDHCFVQLESPCGPLDFDSPSPYPEIRAQRMRDGEYVSRSLWLGGLLSYHTNLLLYARIHDHTPIGSTHALEQLLPLTNTEVMLLTSLCLVYKRANDWTAVLRIAERGRQHNSDSLFFNTACLIGYETLQQLPEAFAAAVRCCHLAPNDVLLHFYAGSLAKDLQRWDDAGRYWQRVVEIDPSHREATHNLRVLRAHREPRT